MISSQHSADIDMETLRREIKENVIMQVLPQDMVDENTKIYINPTGRFIMAVRKGIAV